MLRMFKPLMRWPTGADLLFSVKSFIGAMLGLYIAFKIGLPRPFWAPLAAYVASQPFAGSTKAKALYRIIGASIGGMGIMFIVPLFFNYTILAALAISAWYAVWIFIALHDRTPRSYAFLLGGYTLGIVAMPTMSNADTINLTTIFDLCINRVEELAVGVGSAALVHAVIFPTRAGNVVVARLDQALKDTAASIRNILDYNRDITAERPNLNKLSATITDLRILTTNIPFEAENLRYVHNILGSTQDHLSALVPVLSSVDDRIRSLKKLQNGLTPEIRILLDDISNWINRGSENPYTYAVQLRRRIDQIAPTISQTSQWHEILLSDFVNNLYQLVDISEHCFGLRRKVDEGMAGKEPMLETRERKVSTLSLMVDKRKAWASAFASFACVFVSTLVWIISGWSSMMAAPMMGGMYCLFFSAVDTPVPLLKDQFWFTVLSGIPSGIYMLWLLPSAHSFEMMVMMFLPFCIMCGCWLTRPDSGLACVPFFFTTFATLTMFDQGSNNMTAFMNVQISQALGIVFSIIFMGVCRTLSAESLIKGVVKTIWKDISALGTATTAPAPTLVAVKLVDGVTLIAPRLAIAQKDHEASKSGTLQSAVNILLDMRIGMNMTKLLRAESKLDSSDSSIRRVLLSLSSYYGREKKVTSEERQSILTEIDEALYNTAGIPSFHHQNLAVAALVGLRCDLFPTAQPYSPATVVNKTP